MQSKGAKTQRINIKDVAKLAGVSQATAARVMGGYGSVSEEAIVRVKEAASELNYYPNSIAQSMKGKGTRTIGVVVANICNLFFGNIVRAIEDTAMEYGYNVIICNSDEDFEKEIVYIQTLYEKRVDAIISSTAYVHGEHSKKKVMNLYNNFIPTLLIDRSIKGLDLPIVQTDNFQGAYDATNYLISLGHSTIGLITGKSNISTMAERLSGYKKALADNNIAINEEYIVDRDNVMLKGGYEGASMIMSLPNRPTAILSLNHLLTIGSLQVLAEKGLRVPEDVSVIGWDDFDLATLLTPPLTVVSQSPYTMGTIAAKKIIGIISNDANKEMNVDEVVGLKNQLIIRKSCRELN